MKIQNLNAKSILLTAAAILLAAIVAIIVHALLPAPVDETLFDGLLVQAFGFPIVASSYFILLFTQCALSIYWIGAQTSASKTQVGLRLGLVFAMMYLLGMQEVVVEGSPFISWGIEFVRYQFAMGLGDAIPALLLCLFISRLIPSKRIAPETLKSLSFTSGLKVTIGITVAIMATRTYLYQSGHITSNHLIYPIPTYVWTLLLGLILSAAYVIIYPLWSTHTSKTYIPFKFAAVVGINWIIFNSFIGLIFQGAMLEMLIRSGLDVLILFLVLRIIRH